MASLLALSKAIHPEGAVLRAGLDARQLTDRLMLRPLPGAHNPLMSPPMVKLGRNREHRAIDGTSGRSMLMPWDPRWFGDPQDFRAERWYGDFAKRLPRFAYMPFGGGPRICIGNRFAMMEAVLILATVAQRYRLEWQSDHPITPVPSLRFGRAAACGRSCCCGEDRSPPRIHGASAKQKYRAIRDERRR